MSKALEELQVEDDGLICGEIRRWAETKYRLISLYDKLFATGMKNKWDQRVYIDLYSGSGFGHIQGTDTRLKGSPILALEVPDRFDKYIFCEENKDLLDALRARTDRIAPAADVTFIEGKCDREVDNICAAIPRYSPECRVLSLCFVDPFDFGLKFETIKRLSMIYTDFLVLLAVGMDANRNYDHYVDGDHPKIDDALGNTEWRERLKAHPNSRKNFRQFLAKEFAKSMQSLNYLKVETHQMKEVRSDEKNLPLYYLALFSRSKVAYKYWEQVLKYGTDQSSFVWE